MAKQILSISLDPAAVEFWDSQLALTGQTRSGWLNHVLRTWASTGHGPRYCLSGPDWNDGIAVAPTIAAQKEAARRQPAVSPALQAARDESTRAATAYKAAIDGAVRLPAGEFQRIKADYYAACDRLAQMEKRG